MVRLARASDPVQEPPDRFGWTPCELWMPRGFWDRLLFVLTVAAAVPVSAAADEVEDVVKLSRAGVAEETILAFVEAAKGGFRLSADRVLELKRENVPERVIAAMLRRRAVPGDADARTPPAGADVRKDAESHGAGAGAGGDTVGGADRSAGAAGSSPGKAARGDGTAGEVAVRIENAGGADLYVAADAGARAVTVSDAAKEGWTLAKRGSAAFMRLNSGKWEIRWEGAGNGIPFEVRGPGVLIIVNRAASGETEAFYASVFEGKEKKAGGRLAFVRCGRLLEGGKGAAGPAETDGTGRAAGGREEDGGGYRSGAGTEQREGSGSGEPKGEKRKAGDRRDGDREGGGGKDTGGKEGGETPPPERIGGSRPVELEVRVVPRASYFFVASPCVRSYTWYPCAVFPCTCVRIGPRPCVGRFYCEPSLYLSYSRARRHGRVWFGLRL
ncbi:MAG: hypothetical protein N3A38_04150 [Planctomycetota bacterium]|nr:hypothetical protein [Planctomycetota bacterium]